MCYPVPLSVRACGARLEKKGEKKGVVIDVHFGTRSRC